MRNNSPFARFAAMFIDLLKPILPTEATFEDDTINIYSLRPIVPVEATFED